MEKLKNSEALRLMSMLELKHLSYDGNRRNALPLDEREMFIEAFSKDVSNQLEIAVIGDKSLDYDLIQVRAHRARRRIDLKPNQIESFKVAFTTLVINYRTSLYQFNFEKAMIDKVTRQN